MISKNHIQRGLFLLISCFICLSLAVIPFQAKYSNLMEKESLGDYVVPFTAVAHDPVIIQNETVLQEFITSEGISGSGTDEDPYVISNYEISEIDGVYSSSVYIQDLNTSIIIENIIIENIDNDLSIFHGFNVQNCSKIIFRDIIIFNITNWGHSDTNTFFGMKIDESSDCELESITMHQCQVSRLYPIYVSNSDEFSISDINCHHNQAHDLFITSGFVDCSNIDLENSVFTNLMLNHSSPSSGDFLYGAYVTNSINISITECTFDEFLSNYSIIMLFIDTVDNIYCAENIWTDFDGAYTYNTLNTVINSEFINNAYSQITTTVLSRIFYCRSGCENNLFSGNTISDITTPELTFFDLDDSSENIITRNKMLTSVYGDDLWFAILASNTNDNQLFYNSIFNSSVDAAYDSGTNNLWSVLTYYDPLSTLTMVGNYWAVHCLDGEGSLHYFVNTPFGISGSTGSKDTYPLHYYGMDFDEDGVINYYEVYYQLDPHDSDTDDDGISDYNEIDWWHGDHVVEEDDIPETNTTEDDDTNNETTTSDPGFFQKLGSDPGAIGIFGATAVLIVIAVQGFLKKGKL